MLPFLLPTFDISSFSLSQVLGSGSYADVKLLYHKERKELMVGKFFRIGGSEEIKRKSKVDFEREARIQACLRHDNIVRIVGITFETNRFGMIMEYISCGDLESFLHIKKHISIPFKIRTSFFKELADGLDYLHYHDPKRSFIHGDLKPQNILLTDTLKIKIADFGSTTIAVVTGSTSISDGNTQHTPLYTAPEFLQNTATMKQTSMDVYSYGLIGYEILTRQMAYSGARIPFDVVLYMIILKGQKPDTKILDNIEGSLERNSEDLKMFSKLRQIVEQCWKFEASERPPINQVKKTLNQLAISASIYDNATDHTAKELRACRGFKLEFSQFYQSNEESKQGLLQNVYEV